MATGKTFTAEQLHRIYNAHVKICAMRDVTLVSQEGREIARRLLNDFTGGEEENEIVRKFLS